MPRSELRRNQTNLAEKSSNNSSNAVSLVKNSLKYLNAMVFNGKRLSY